MLGFVALLDLVCTFVSAGIIDGIGAISFWPIGLSKYVIFLLKFGLQDDSSLFSIVSLLQLLRPSVGAMTIGYVSFTSFRHFELSKSFICLLTFEL